MLCCADASLAMARASGTVRSRHIQELYSVVLAAHLAGKPDSEKWHRPAKHLGFAGGIIVAPVSTLPILALGQKLSTGPAPHW